MVDMLFYSNFSGIFKAFLSLGSYCLEVSHVQLFVILRYVLSISTFFRTFIMKCWILSKALSAAIGHVIFVFKSMCLILFFG